MATVIDRDLGWKRIVAELTAVDGKAVKVGVLSDAGSEAGGQSLASVATYNEFGTSRGIPPRPFMAQTFETRNREISEFIAKQKDAVLDGKATFSGALGKIGEKYKGMIQREIASGGFAANAPATIRQKGSSKPLIDTGRLRQSINWELET